MIAATLQTTGKVWTPEAASVAEEALSGALEASAEAIAQATRQAAEKASGTLAGSIHTEGSGLEVTVAVDAPYAQAVELGRKAAYTPIRPLAQWAETKLGLSGDEAERAAYRISHSKSQRATPPKPFWQPGYDAAEPEVAALLEAVPQTVVESL